LSLLDDKSKSKADNSNDNIRGNINQTNSPISKHFYYIGTKALYYKKNNTQKLEKTTNNKSKEITIDKLMKQSKIPKVLTQKITK
jgi:hypothetical protein